MIDWSEQLSAALADGRRPNLGQGPLASRRHPQPTELARVGAGIRRLSDAMRCEVYRR